METSTTTTIQPALIMGYGVASLIVAYAAILAFVV